MSALKRWRPCASEPSRADFAAAYGSSTNPITDYERYVCEWGYALNYQAGETEIFVLSTTARSSPCTSQAPHQERVFGDESGTRSALAIESVSLREIEGAAEALAPVLELPPPKRIHGIVTSVEHVRTALSAIEKPGRDAVELAGAIKGFASARLALTETAQHGVTLAAGRVRLREFRLDDLDDADAILGDDRVTRWLSFDSRTCEQQAQVLTGAIERAEHTPRTEYYPARLY